MYLDSDEWYPVLTLREERYKWMKDLEVEISPELLEKHKRIMDEFDAFQLELSKLPTKTLPKIETIW